MGIGVFLGAGMGSWAGALVRILAAILLATLLPPLPAGAAPDLRTLCHDHTLKIVSGGRETPWGSTDVATLRRKLAERYRFVLVGSYGNLRAVPAEHLRPGTVVIVGDAHSGVVGPDGRIEQYYGETYGSATVLHWTVKQLWDFERTRNVQTGAPLPQATYPLRDKPVQLWANFDRARAALAEMGPQVRELVDFANSVDIRRLILQAEFVVANIGTGAGRCLDLTVGEQPGPALARLLGRLHELCANEPGFRRTLTEALEAVRRAADTIVTAHDDTRRAADLACTGDPRQAGQYRDEASRALERAQRAWDHLRLVLGDLRQAGVAELFDRYHRLERYRDCLDAVALRASVVAGENVFTEEGLAGLRGRLEGTLARLMELQRAMAPLAGQIEQDLGPFRMMDEELARLWGDYAALKRTADAAGDPLVRSVLLFRDQVPAAFKGRALSPQTQAEALAGQCAWVPAVESLHGELESHVDPAQLFIVRSHTEYQRAVDCAEAPGPGRRAAVLHLSAAASAGTVQPSERVAFTYRLSTGDNPPLSDVTVQDGLCGSARLRQGDTNGNQLLDRAETWIYECSQVIGQDTRNLVSARARDDAGDPVHASAIVEVALAEAEADEEDQEASRPSQLWLEPARSTVHPGDEVRFTASLIYRDGREEPLPAARLSWEPGPGSLFRAGEPGIYWVTARFQGLTAIATVTVEATPDDRTRWERPVSGTPDRGQAPPAPPEAYTWYALCDRHTGDVVYGERPDPTRHDVLGGPFPGPRGVREWIGRHHPSWRCPSARAGTGQWNVLCDKRTYAVAIGRSVDPTRYWTMRGGFAGEPEARAWVGSNCPAWRCGEGGACATAPQGGGDWAVVCSKSHGGVGLTQQPDPTSHWVYVRGLRSEPDARTWAQAHCPSWRCDRSGQCLAGAARRPDQRPLELPPEPEPPVGWGSPARPPDGGVPPPGPATPPPVRDGTPGPDARPADPPSQRADCSKQRDEFFQRCKKIGDDHVRKNCAPERAYSGCALDVAGCLNAYIFGALPDDYCGRPGYVGCVTGPLNAYLGCLQSCNARFLAGAINSYGLTPCRTDCQAGLEAATKACQAGRTPPAPKPQATPAAPDQVPPPASPSGRFRPMERGVDRPGMDYRHFDLPSPDPALCQQACALEPRCKAYTYVKPGVQVPAARCWLKHSVPPAIPGTCCVSGVRE